MLLFFFILLTLGIALVASWSILVGTARRQPPVRPSSGAGDEDAPTNADPELLCALVDPKLSEPERQLTLDALGGEPLWFEGITERVGSTQALQIPDAYRGGRTLYALAGPLPIAVRFPLDRDTELDTLSPGEPVRIRARVCSWDALTRRLILEAP